MTQGAEGFDTPYWEKKDSCESRDYDGCQKTVARKVNGIVPERGPFVL